MLAVVNFNSVLSSATVRLRRRISGAINLHATSCRSLLTLYLYLC